MKTLKQFEEFIEDKQIQEANIDGTINPNEEQEMEDLIIDLNFMLGEIINMVDDTTQKIGGKFRGPGYRAECAKVIQQKLQKAKLLK